jgi:hypothetical protein
MSNPEGMFVSALRGSFIFSPMEFFPLASSVSQVSEIRYRIRLYQCLPPSLQTSTIHPSIHLLLVFSPSSGSPSSHPTITPSLRSITCPDWPRCPPLDVPVHSCTLLLLPYHCSLPYTSSCAPSFLAGVELSSFIDLGHGRRPRANLSCLLLFTLLRLLLDRPMTKVIAIVMVFVRRMHPFSALNASIF